MLRTASIVLGTFVIVATILPLLRWKAWWIRIWDFPRFQLAVAGTISLAVGVATNGAGQSAPRVFFLAAIAIAVLYQSALIWRYSPIAPLEVEQSHSADEDSRLALAVSNVLETNRDADRLLKVIRAADADVLLFVETDEWWREKLDALLATHPHTVQCPLSNTYGMLLYSRLPLLDTTIDFLIEPDIPSMQAQVKLSSGTFVWLNCVHPRPPAPGESDESLQRDAELLLVGKRVCEATRPVVVCGDLNDVAWSRTTRLFQKTSRLVDPRKGRGMFSTFHARVPGFRFPLDHILHSSDFRLVSMRRLPSVGSDHFPVYAMLSYEPAASAEQEAPEADAADRHETRETIAEGKSGGRSAELRISPALACRTTA
jgi:endonuclease/exonuclease/phosphatase (EEP) superfamily protein YafD